MPNIATHIIIPLFCLFIFYKDKKDAQAHKYLIALLPFALLPDLDLIFGLEGHRQIFHNIFFLIGVYLIGKTFFDNKFLFPAMFFISSHTVLDLFDTYGIGLFYPLILKDVYVAITLTLDLNSLRNVVFSFDYGFMPSHVVSIDKIYIIDSVGFISLSLIIISYIFREKP